MLFAASFSGSLDDFFGYDGAQRVGDDGLFELAGDDKFDLVLEAEGDFGDLDGGDGRGDVFG